MVSGLITADSLAEAPDGQGQGPQAAREHRKVGHERRGPAEVRMLCGGWAGRREGRPGHWMETELSGLFCRGKRQGLQRGAWSVGRLGHACRLEPGSPAGPGS